MEDGKLRVGSSVLVVGKNLKGTVAYIGTTQFSPGKWVGVVLNEPLGKNNGTVQGKRYFDCQENCGLFVRVPQSAKGSPQVPKLSIQKPPSQNPTNESLVEMKGNTSIPRLNEPTKPLPVSPASPKAQPEPSVTVVDTIPVEIRAELENLRAEVKDVTEKLEVMKAKRAEDRVKLKEAESLKIQLAQLEENRKLMQEKSADLQRQEAAEKQAAFDRYREEMSDLTDTVEMATLDKEMAEEKLESVNIELESLKEKVEELLLENQILKEEQANTPLPSGDGESTGGPTLAQMKQLEQQNERMKMGLVTFRNLANQDKQEIASLTKEEMFPGILVGLLKKPELFPLLMVSCRVAALQSEVSCLNTEKERLTEELKQALEHTIELKEQVDAALGADQMVSVLTQKNLELEDKVEKLTEERNDLESLCEMNDELLEGERERQLDLTEQIELARGQIRELLRQLEANKETVADYELTISKFREVVTQLQTQNTHLNQSLADARRTASSASLVAMAADQSATAAEASALMLGHIPGRQPEAQTIAKVIETELRKLDAEQGAQHVEWLSGFLPESFSRRSGDHDAILLLLLVSRLIFKCDLLATQVRKRYPLPTCIRGLASTTGLPASVPASPLPVKFTTGGDEIDEVDIFKTQGELASFTSFLILLLRYWQGLLLQFKSVLSSCCVNRFSKLVTLYGDLSMGHEQTLNHLLDLCKRDQLDETVSLEDLVSSVNFFVNVHTIHVIPVLQANPDSMDSTEIISSFAHIVLACSEAITVDATCLAAFTGLPFEIVDSEGEADVDAGLPKLINQLGQMSSSIRANARSIRRRLPSNTEAQPLCLPPSQSSCLDLALHKLVICARCLFATTKSTGQMVATQMAEHTSLDTSVVLRECLVPSTKMVLSETDIPAGNTTPVESSLVAILEGVSRQVSATASAMEHGEYDFDGTKKAKKQEPIVLRAVAYKRAQSDLESCRGKLELKEEEVRELQVALKKRADEISELTVRVNMAEKKLETSGKGNLEKIIRLEQRLQMMENEQKQTEKYVISIFFFSLKCSDYEHAIDAMNSDVEKLKKENIDLKERLRKMSKNAIHFGVAESSSSSAAQSSTDQTLDVSGTPTGSSPMTLTSKLSAYKEASVLLNEIEVLREALKYVSSENVKLKGRKFHVSFLSSIVFPQTLTAIEQVAALRPLLIPHRGCKEKTQAVDEGKENQSPTLTQLTRQLKAAVSLYHNVLATTSLVKLPSGGIAKPSETPEAQLAYQTERLVQAKNELEKAQEDLLSFAMSKPGYGAVKADFATFASSRTAHKLGLETSSDGRLIGRITVPRGADTTSDVTQRLSVSSDELRALMLAPFPR
ncbi:unnamed protein product [Mesocestoides corti]|uniref:Dynactin subunit 1 n=1 Tax=Mesocestoides corti TaxID=53468 RepID=A0A158QUX9_MESCO|nr:unnamed protein product [Mesocestoides corti]